LTPRNEARDSVESPAGARQIGHVDPGQHDARGRGYREMVLMLEAAGAR
jgi:hypothetical protein